VARNYSNIELLDKQIGERLKELEEDGLLDNTIIFFYSDHGGPLPRGKRLHYDSGLQTPFFVRIPDKLKGEYDDELISFVDLAPTILSLAGIEPPEYMQGQAFLGKYKAEEPRKYIYGSGDRFDEHTDRIRIVRDDRYLYVRNYYPELPAYKDIKYRRQIPMMNELLRLNALGELNRDQNYWFRLKKTKEEFYDSKTDSLDLHNLINDPQYKDKIEEMRKVMDQWLDETGDMAAIPEKQMFLQMWPGGKQPLTERPIISKEGKYVTLSCDTEGASIGYILTGKKFTPDLNSGWKLYYEPVKVKKGQIMYVMAQRLGFKESEIVVEEF